MDYKIGICDDRQEDIQYTCEIVKKWISLSKHTATLKTFPSAEAFLFQYESDKDYDILLLDIEMGKMNGVDLAKKIRAENRELQIVFITGYNDYIADGYEVEALHYILKPIQEEKLIAVLDRACEKRRKAEDALFLKQPDGMLRIPLYTIRYLEVRGNYVTIHADTEVSVKSTLSAMEQKLDEAFFKAGRSFLVNLHYIRKITKKEILLEDGSRIPLSRGVYEPLNQAFIRYF